MSTTTITTTGRRRRRRLARISVALAAVVSIGALTAGTAAAESAPARDVSAIFCWKEYDFTRSGNTLTATAYKDCTTYEVPQLLPVSIHGFYSDEAGPSGWFTLSSGIGTAKATCNTGFPMWYRHSATMEIIYC